MACCGDDLSERIVTTLSGYRARGRSGWQRRRRPRTTSMGGHSRRLADGLRRRLPARGDVGLFERPAPRRWRRRSRSAPDARDLQIAAASASHAFRPRVLGRLRPPRAHRRAALPARAGGALARLGRKPARGDTGARLERQGRRHLRQPRRRRVRRQRAAVARDRLRRRQRPAFRLHRRTDRPAPRAQRHVAALRRAGRFWRADRLVRRLHLWYVDALAASAGSTRRAGCSRSCWPGDHVGLLSEDIDPATGELWGNFPQTYSLVGVIILAMGLSRGWEHAR